MASLGKYEDASQFTSSISTKKETSFDSFHFQPLLQGVAWYFERYTRTCTRTRFERSTNCPEPEFRSHFSQLYFRNLGSVLAKFGGRLSKFRSERNLLIYLGAYQTKLWLRAFNERSSREHEFTTLD